MTARTRGARRPQNTGGVVGVAATIAGNVALSSVTMNCGAASTSVGGVDHLLLTASLPSSASGNAFEGATTSLDFVFHGTPRAATAR